MAITITIFESVRQIIEQIPEYIQVSIDGVTNANVYYTFDGSNPDPTGSSPSTFLMEHEPGDPLHGTIFLPTTANFLALSMLAVGVSPSDTTTFFRRYGFEDRKLGPPNIKELTHGHTAFITTPSPNKTTDGQIIAPDGYTTGSAILTKPPKVELHDGYTDGHYVAVSGEQVVIPSATFDHVIGYTDGTSPDGYVTTTLTDKDEQRLIQLSDRGNIFVAVPDAGSSTGSKRISTPDLQNIDPRSTTIRDYKDRQIEIIPTELEATGYTTEIDGYDIRDDLEEEPTPQIVDFTTSGIFDPMAAYIEIDGRVDGYINGELVRPGDRTIVNKPYGDLRYVKGKQDLGDAVRKTTGIGQGGLVAAIPNYQTNTIVFYYADLHDQRWIKSIQKFEPPKFEIFAVRNGVVVGQVFPWIWNRRQVLPG